MAGAIHELGPDSWARPALWYGVGVAAVHGSYDELEFILDVRRVFASS
jgi:hypothetical protein